MVTLRVRYEPVARAAASRAGIDPELFVRQITQESGWAEDVIDCRRSSPAGARGIAQIVDRFHPNVNPCDPEAALDYAARLMAGHLQAYGGDWALALACYNAGPGATAAGLAGNLAGWPYAETVRYVSAILQIPEEEARRRLTGAARRVAYDPDAPITPQPDDWSCAVRSAQWLLRAIGRRPGDDWIVQQLLGDGLVTREHGLMDASGRALAAWLQREYGDEMSLRFEAASPVTWERVVALAGRQPVLIGGRAWNHWAGVRRLVDGALELANPDPGWQGTGTVLDRSEWDRLGPWSLVTVPIPDATPVPVDPRDVQLHDLATKLGYATGDVVAALEREAAALESSLRALYAAISSLKRLR
jgi:hypothetical protein